MSNITSLLLLLVGIVVLVLILVGGMVLQMHLSKKESKWMGLILPIILFLLSLVLVVRMVLSDRVVNGEYFVDMGMVLLASNIPTIIYLVIYSDCREKINGDREKE